MAKNQIDFKLNLESREAQRQLKDAAETAGDLGDEFDETESAGQAMARAIEQSTADMIDEIDRTKRAVDAMDEALGDVDMDPRKVVADLKRVGLTAEDIEADADALADALRRAGDVEVHATAKGFDDVSQAVGRVGDEAGRAGDVATGAFGGMVGELHGVSGALGPVGEGLGQLAEGALDGSINVKSLVAAGAGMAALGYTVQQINGHFEKQAAIKAFRAEQVEAYEDALKDVDSTLDGVIAKLEDAGGVSVNIFGDELDLTPVLVKAGLTVEQFGEIVEGGAERLEEWKEAADDAGISGDVIQGVALAATSEIDALSEATEAAAVNAAFFATDVDKAAGKADQLTQSAGSMARSLDGAGNSARDAAADVRELDSVLSDLRSALNMEQALADFNTKVETAFTEAESDIIDSEQGIRDYQQLINDTAADIDNLPPEIVLKMIAQSEDGVTTAEAARAASVFQQYLAQNPATIYARLQVLNSQGVTANQMVLGNVNAGRGSSSRPSASAGMARGHTTHNYNISTRTGATAAEIAHAIHRQQRMNQ